MVHRISGAGLQVRQYFHRYSEDALDLCDVFGSYSPGATSLASTVPLPAPMPEPLDHCGVIYSTGEGIIEQITDAGTLQSISELRDKIISSSDGHRGMHIVEVAVGKQCRPGQPTSRILDILESNTRRAYEIYLDENQVFRF